MFIRLFGRVTVEGASIEVDGGSPTQKKLLALLALEAGRVVKLDQLYEAMWPDDLPANAEQMIRIYVSRLRKALGQFPDVDEPLLTETGGYRLAISRASVDVLRFEQMAIAGQDAGDPHLIREAMRLWRDDPLSEFIYDDWALVARERLGKRRVDALEAALGLEMDLSAAGPAILEVESLISENPLRERLWSYLILGLHRSGRQAEAFRAYERCRSELAEVGLEPGAELSAVIESISTSPARESRRDPTPIPLEWDSFVGREDVLDEVALALTSTRLLTLVGPGGSGKTRIAIRIASASNGSVMWSDLTSAASHLDVERALRAAAGSDLNVSLGEAFSMTSADASGLLIVDNCEQVIDIAARYVETLLGSVPGLTIVATSREPLKVKGERVVRLETLELPSVSTAEALESSEAGRLFLDRANQVTRLELSEADVGIAFEIVRQLDGIPLAIELAAARLDSTSLRDLSESLVVDLIDAGAGSRSLMPRHRTLKATLDWSYRLLQPSSQVLLRRLGVVRGDFDVELVNDLASSPAELHDLVSKSMAVASEGGFRLLVPVRSYALAALDRLDETNEAVQLRDGHYLRRAREMTVAKRPFADPRLQEEFRRFRPNLLPALEGLLDRDPAAAAALINDLAEFWQLHGYFDEGQRLIEKALQGELDPGVEVDLLLQLGRFRIQTHSAEVAHDVIEDALQIAEDTGDGPRIALAHLMLGNTLATAGHISRAVGVLEQAVTGYERFRPDERFVPVVNLTAVLAWGGHAGRCDELLEELARVDLPGQFEALVPGLAGVACRVAGDLERGDDLFDNALERFDVHRSTFHRGLCLVERALVRLWSGDADGADFLARVALEGGNEQVPIYIELRAQRVLAEVALARGESAGAREIVVDSLGRSVKFANEGARAELVDTAAAVALEASPSLAEDLALVADTLRESLGLARDPYEADRRAEIGTATPSNEPDPIARFVAG